MMKQGRKEGGKEEQKRSHEEPEWEGRVTKEAGKEMDGGGLALWSLGLVIDVDKLHTIFSCCKPKYIVELN